MTRLSKKDFSGIATA
ncbi:hypothetical protein J001_02568 [Cryptococcus neoformans]|nr:hypothetical protein J000_02576 [Cryptococcus neoformans var. grubii]OXH71569.1 hypothetical protein J001_02568 [Cryptococcus neoformans var. grubii]